MIKCAFCSYFLLFNFSPQIIQQTKLEGSHFKESVGMVLVFIFCALGGSYNIIIISSLWSSQQGLNISVFLGILFVAKVKIIHRKM
jgi:hypothetical protein